MPKSGSLHHNAKLTDDIVEDIVWRYRQGGNSYMSLALEYNVEVSTINKILRGKTWKHITGGEHIRKPPRAPRTHCTKGHELTPENTVLVSSKGRPNPSKACRRCMNDRKNAYRRRKRGNYR